MPRDDDGKRYFMSDEKIPRKHYYSVDSWVREGEFPRRRKRLNQPDLAHMDLAVFKVYPAEQPTRVGYVTVFGPWETWEDVEGVLEYDFGEEGSLQIGVAA